MELGKGVCFSCDTKTLILNDCSDRIQQIFLYLYTETVLNVNKLQSIIPALKLCPVCHHKLIVLEQIYRHIEANQNKKDENENCALCKKGDFIFKITKHYFKDIADDFPFLSDKHKCDVCSQCCFYLDCRYYLKKRLFSQYPQLRIVPKLKLKFGSEITTHSTPLVTPKREHLRQHKRSSSEVILVESDTEMPPQETSKGLDLSSIKSFKVLRNNKLISKSKKICRDSKLLNQILYVKLSKKYSASDEKTSKNTEAQKDVTKLPKTRLKKPSMIKEKDKKFDEIREKDKKFDEIVDSKEQTSMEKNESNLKNSSSKADIETSESVPISGEDSHETSEDSLNMKKPTYFKIKLKKHTTRTNKLVVKEHVEKSNTVTDKIKKSLIVNLERRAVMHATGNALSKKDLENDEDMSIEVTESEERRQTVNDSLRMDLDSKDNSKPEEHSSLESAEGKDSETNSEKEQFEHNHETSPDENKISSKESVESDGESKTEKSNENYNEEESSGNTVSNSQCAKSIPENDGDEEKGNPDEEQPSKDEEKEKVQISDDKEDSSQISVNEEEISNEKSGDTTEDAVSKTKADINQEKTDEETETDDRELPGSLEEMDEKNNEDEASDKKETGAKKETDDEKTDDNEEVNNKNKEGSSDEKEEIGIDEEDRNNIDMMLSGLGDKPVLTEEDAEEAENSATDNSKDVSNADRDNDIVTGCKRKRSDSSDVTSPEKKKKKVTFSEEVLESSE